ncbi:MAG: S41 family peptidase [Candidatus Doudnabacteria bacterium]|nr:S41 family peptidase [Candidatus Doudnabacteria bacterium]
MDLQENQTEEKQQLAGHKAAGLALRWLIILLVVCGAYFSGFQSGKKGFSFDPKEFKVINQSEAPATVDYSLLWKALDVVQAKYIEKNSINQQKVLYGAIKGAVESLGDPYTTFFEPKTLESFKTDLKGSFGGIGAEVGKKDNNIVIVAPLDDTPAKKAGLQAKDIIVSVDGQSTADWSVDQAVDKIRGEKGTAVTLSIYRQGKDKPFDVKIVRDIIAVKSVKLSYKETEVNGQKKTVAVITLSRFGDDTLNLFTKAVNEILSKNVSGIVLDLRNDPGGYLQTAVDVASSWLNSGDLVVSEAKSDGTSNKYNAEGNNRLKGIKTVVLINGGSASAAEILSGALHDHNIAKLIGEKSFGKGSVQELVDLPGGSAVKVTVAKWITPGGKNLNHDGLEPDIPVKLTDEDFTAGKDPQMDKAVEELSK